MADRPSHRRRWESTLAENIPTGPQGQPAHAAGSSVTVIMSIALPEVTEGGVSISVPSAATMLLRQAEQQLQSAADLRGRLPSTVKRGKWIQAGHEYGLDEDLAFDFLEQAMAGVLLAHSALDNFSIELLPENSAYTDPESGAVHDRRWIESLGVEYRLSRIAAAITGRPNIRTHDTALWARVAALKMLRDDAVHARWETGYSLSGNDTVWGRLLRDADVRCHGETVAAVMDHYRAA